MVRAGTASCGTGLSCGRAFAALRRTPESFLPRSAFWVEEVPSPAPNGEYRAPSPNATSAQGPQAFVLHKPSGPLTPRARAVGPEHFGIVATAGAKSRSRFFLADFYGRTLLEPATRPHTRGDFQAATDRIRHAQQQHGLHDLVVAIERTGDYHRPVQRACH